ncbi:MAG TPA: TonB family protein [Gemmatimonadaceae bacterium]|nr:TonB family protein [Gemmatimonadaceae bacterium]
MGKKLLETLPESDHRRRAGAASRVGTTASVVAHAALITLAVVATGMSHDGPRRPPKPVDEHPIFIVTPPDDRPAHHDGGGVGSTAGGPTERRATEEHPMPTLPPVGPIEEGIPTPVVGVAIGDEFGHGDAPATVGDAGGTSGGGGAGTGGVFDGHTVEVPAALRAGSPVPRYPDALRASRVAGQVVVRFVVDTTGRVEPSSVQVTRSTDPLFTAAVRATLPSLRFTPARARGAKVRQLVELPFEFEVE